MAKGRFWADGEVVELNGNEYAFRSLTVAELEGLVSESEGKPERELTAAIIAASSDDGQLVDVTAEELEEWPVGVFQKVQRVVQRLNGLGADPGN